MTTATPEHTSIRITRDLGPHLASRGDSPSAVVRRDINRYYDAIEAALREIRLSESEWNFLRAILNGSILDEATARVLYAEIEDAEPEFAEQFGIDQRGFAGRIRTMPAFTRLAIVDAVERWWHSQGNGRE